MIMCLRTLVEIWLVQYCILHMLTGNNADYYVPTIIWNLDNPVLQRANWQNVIHLKSFDILTFMCPNQGLYVSGTNTFISKTNLYHNLYVKEIPRDLEDFTGACNVTGAKFVQFCDKPLELLYFQIPISKIQAIEDLPAFKQGRYYMFFATSNGKKSSLSTSENRCTMVFRIHYIEHDGTRPEPKKLLRKMVDDCNDVMMNVSSISTTNTTITVGLQPPNKISCNISSYGVGYKEYGGESWTEVLVPSHQTIVTVVNLKPSTKYTIRVKAYGNMLNTGQFSKEITVETDKNPPSPAPRTGDDASSIDALSLAIGVVIGTCVVLMANVILWWCLVGRYRRRKAKEQRRGKTDGVSMEEIALKDGYHDSGVKQGWKLPKFKKDVSHA